MPPFEASGVTATKVTRGSAGRGALGTGLEAHGLHGMSALQEEGDMESQTLCCLCICGFVGLSTVKHCEFGVTAAGGHAVLRRHIHGSLKEAGPSRDGDRGFGEGPVGSMPSSAESPLRCHYPSTVLSSLTCLGCPFCQQRGWGGLCTGPPDLKLTHCRYSVSPFKVMN